MPLALDEDLVMSAGRRPVGARPRDSVQAPQARTSQFDEHDYDEIDDGDCIGKILIFTFSCMDVLCLRLLL